MLEVLNYLGGAVLLVLLAMVVYGTIAKNKWGINFRQVSCPKCGTPAPRVRAAGSGSEALWGGHTCERCGCRMDKWGRQLAG